jgi:hypothetical protein
MSEDLNSSRGTEPAFSGARADGGAADRLRAALEIASKYTGGMVFGEDDSKSVIFADIYEVLDRLEQTERDFRHFQYDTDVIEGSYIAALKEADDFISSEFENLTSGFTDREDAAQVLSTIRALIPTKVDLTPSTPSPA